MNDANRAYLIRFQRVEMENCWRASIENAYTGEIIHFRNENALLLYVLHSLKDGLQIVQVEDEASAD